MSPVCWGGRGHPRGEEEGEVPTVPPELAECPALLRGAAPVRPACRARIWALGAEVPAKSLLLSRRGGSPGRRSPQCSPCPLAGAGAALSGRELEKTPGCRPCKVPPLPGAAGTLLDASILQQCFYFSAKARKRLPPASAGVLGPPEHPGAGGTTPAGAESIRQRKAKSHSVH